MDKTTSCFCMNVLCAQAGRCLKYDTLPTCPPADNKTYVNKYPDYIGLSLEEAAKQSKQAERRELFKQVALRMTSRLSYEWEGSQAVGLSLQSYNDIAKATQAILSAAHKFSKGEL